MAYNKRNYLKKVQYIMSVYQGHKYADVSDASILRNIFPKHNIHISYRQWMNIKSAANHQPAPTVQHLSLFD
jgi:hypothetical protein